MPPLSNTPRARYRMRIGRGVAAGLSLVFKMTCGLQVRKTGDCESLPPLPSASTNHRLCSSTDVFWLDYATTPARAKQHRCAIKQPCGLSDLSLQLPQVSRSPCVYAPRERRPGASHNAATTT